MKKTLRQKLRKWTRRHCFHNRLLSAVVAEFMILMPSKQNGRIERGLRYLEQYGRINGLSDEKTKRNALFHMFFSGLFYASSYAEVFLYGLEGHIDSNKLNYVCEYELYHYYRLLNKLGAPTVLNKKEKTYERFHDFYGRELIYFSSAAQKEEFLSFFRRHSSGIIKPSDQSGGIGVEILQITNDTDPEQLWEKSCTKMPFVLEELIEQAPEMNSFYPDAVNTVRYVTFFHNGVLTRMLAALRLGRGGSVVDNATSGGIYTLVDTETGRIKGPARSDLAERFENHPDTGIRFEGSIIPRWDELNELVEKVVRVVPEQKLVGWDFALSKDGWIMVEGNAAPALQSFDLDHGMRAEITGLFKELIPVWR